MAPKLFVPGEAAYRSAASFWSMRTSRAGRVLESTASIHGVEIAYGRFATILAALGTVFEAYPESGCSRASPSSRCSLSGKRGTNVVCKY